MGRKNRFDGGSKRSSYNHRNSDHVQKRGRTRTRSPTPERARDGSPYPRGSRQTVVEATISRTLSPPRGQGYGNIVRMKPTPVRPRETPPSLHERIEGSRSSVYEESRRGERPTSPDRIQNPRPMRS